MGPGYQSHGDNVVVGQFMEIHSTSPYLIIMGSMTGCKTKSDVFFSTEQAHTTVWR